MEIILNIIFLVAYCAVVVLGLRYYTHMLQLSSYQFQGYFRFLGTIQSKFGLHVGAMCTIIGAAIMGRFKSNTVLLVLAILFLLFTIPIYLPKPAKKKFVVTKRVERLFATYAVLAILFLVVSIIETRISPRGNLIAGAIWGIYMGLLPFVTALANLINKPIEKKINDYYINDAKRILKEHPGLRIIGITGSFGKTSVKYYLTT
ncbi:MAG: hypothetical protein J6N21_10960, partial [Butyrivibrio sp.]|nr:hypothetical protein [Butyrivibrio sp.]